MTVVEQVVMDCRCMSFQSLSHLEQKSKNDRRQRQSSNFFVSSIKLYLTNSKIKHCFLSKKANSIQLFKHSWPHHIFKFYRNNVSWTQQGATESHWEFEFNPMLLVASGVNNDASRIRWFLGYSSSTSLTESTSPAKNPRKQRER